MHSASNKKWGLPIRSLLHYMVGSIKRENLPSV